MKIKVAYQAEDKLGEGPVWSVAEQALYWVDIERPCLQRWQPSSGAYMAWMMPSQIGCFALRASGGTIVGLRDGLYSFDLDSGDMSAICRPEATLNTRFNDGKCDRHGRFWAGTMDMKIAAPLGALYRLDRNGNCRQMVSAVTCSNGLGWSPDNRTMYVTDSPTHTIFAYDFDLQTGDISSKRIFAQDTEGFPDGLTVDSDGFVWSAKWDGWKIVRYAPDGFVDREITLPVARPTSCIFGGPDLNLLYVTSASVGLSAAERAEQPLAGQMFMLETAVAGLPEPLFVG
ncbi:MAG: SMP-30/gluconolactonase/LRE family protein [Chloroflexi bacterium]|nr:SMP-30/gluconolactonase/LRE family protein [Chloroflexota bacterium]